MRINGTFKQFKFKAMPVKVLPIASWTNLLAVGSIAGTVGNVNIPCISADGQTVSFYQSTSGPAVYRLVNGVYTLAYTLNTGSAANYGARLSADGNTVTFADAGTGNGRILTGIRNPATGVWTAATAAPSFTTQQFGAQHSISPTGYFMAAKGNNTNPGLYLMFRGTGTTWTTNSRIVSPNSQPGDIGYATYVRDNGTVFMSIGDTGFSGTNALGVYNGSSISAFAVPTFTTAGSNYITDLTATPDGVTVVIGQKNFSTTGRLCVLTGTNWATQTVLAVPTGIKNLGSLTSTAINATGTAIVAAVTNTTTNQGAIYLWQQTGGTWGAPTLVKANTGFNVGLSANTLITQPYGINRVDISQYA